MSSITNREKQGSLILRKDSPGTKKTFSQLAKSFLVLIHLLRRVQQMNKQLFYHSPDSLYLIFHLWVHDKTRHKTAGS